MNCLKIIASCLRNLKDEYTAQNIAQTNVLEIILELLNNPSKNEDQQTVCFEILQRLSNFPQNHELIGSKGLFQYLADNLSEFLKQDIALLKNEQLGLLVRSFYIITNFCKNNAISEYLSNSNLVQKFIEVHEKSKDISFLNELFINSLYSIISSYQGIVLFKDYNIDLKNLVISSVNSSNKKVIENTESIVIKLMKNEDLKLTLDSIQKGDTSFENLAYLAFMSKNQMMSDLLDDTNLVNFAMSILSRQDLKQEQQFGLIKFLSCVVCLSDPMIKYFDSINGIQIILSKINDSKSFIIWTEYMNLLSNLLKNMNKEEVIKYMPVEPIQRICQFYEQMNISLDNFLKNALTPEKAHDSLEFNKNEVTRSLLLEMKSVKNDELVSSQIALDYISAEHFIVSIFTLLQQIGEFKAITSIQLSEEFITTCSLIMKVFKNSKLVHEKMFGMLCTFPINAKIGSIIIKLGWPFNLSDVVWKKPNWKIFAYYVMKFMEIMIKDKDTERQLKGNSSAIKLIASIKNFIIEEDYKDFDETESDLKENESRDVLTFAQEREVYKKGTLLVSLLTDSSTLQTFKNNVDKSIKSFKPKQEIIQILRAEYAVLTCLNGDNFFGNDGLKNSMHNILAKNMAEIEKSVKGQNFVDKEKLMADCIRSIANFICITWNESGKNAYEKANVSGIVFELFEKYLKESNTPLASYIMLKALKEWLINRIEIIENASNLERDKIYDPESFMLVPLEQKEFILTSVMDALYLTNQRFKNNEKVVSLNFEIIILLGYIYPAWKTKVAKNFIPQALDSLSQDNLTIQSDMKAIELLKQLTGTDEKCEEVNTEALEAAIGHGALQKLCKSITDNKFDKKYIICAKPLMEAFGAYEVKVSSKETQNLVLANLLKIDKFNKMPLAEKNKAENLNELGNVLDELNSYELIEHLQKFMLVNKHPELLGELWNFVNTSAKNNGANELLFAKIDKACSLGISNHLSDSETISDVTKQLFGNPKNFKFQNESSNLLINAFKSLQKYNTDPEAVLQNSKIINACFPSAHSLTCQRISKELKFQPTLEFIFNSFGSNEDRELAQEANNLYFNLTEKQDDKIVEKMIKKIMRKFKQDISTGNVCEIESSFLTMIPFLKNHVFVSNQEDFSTDDYILKTLLLLHSKLKEKIDKTTMILLNDAIGNSNIPDIGDGNKKILADEIALARTLTDYILALPENLSAKVATRQEIVKLSDIAFLLTGNQKSFDLIEEYCKNKEAKETLGLNKTFEIASYLLLKRTKDSFKPIDFTINENIAGSVIGSMIGSSNLTKSMMGNKSKIGPQSTISFQASEENQQERGYDEAKVEAFEKILNRYASLSIPILNKNKISNIIEIFIKEMSSFKSGDQKQLTYCIAISRLMACLLAIKDCDIGLENYSESLQKTAIKYLDSISEEPHVNKKLMRFFEDILGKVAKKLDNGPKEFRNQELWNKLLERYFVVAPESLKLNHKRIIKCLDLTKPRTKDGSSRKKQFEEKSGLLNFLSESGGVNMLSARNTVNVDAILTNIKKLIETSPVDHTQILKSLEGLTRSKEFTAALIVHPIFEMILAQVANYNEFENEQKFQLLSESLLNCLALAVKEPSLKQAINQKIHPDNLVRVYLDNIDNMRRNLLPKSLEALTYIFLSVDNSSAFFQKRLPEKILDIIGPGEDWNGESVPSVLLFGLMTKDQSLEKISSEVELLKHVLQNMKNTILKGRSSVINPSELFNRQLNDLSKNPEIQNAELVAFTLGELSKYDHNASELAQKDGKSCIFELYEAYEKHDNQPIIATKIIEATRNAVYALEDETIENCQQDVDKMLAKIPDKIQKYKHLNLVPRYLREILEFFQDKKKATPDKILTFKNMNKGILFTGKQSINLESSGIFKNMDKSVIHTGKQSMALEDSGVFKSSNAERPSSMIGEIEVEENASFVKKRTEVLSKSIAPVEMFKSNDISHIYRYIADELEKKPLSCEDAKMYEVANQKLEEILKNPQDSNVYTMMNLQVPECLRLIANSNNSTNIQKFDALKLLNEFLEKKDLISKFVENTFYLQKSAELINQFATLCPDISQLKPSERDPFLEDLKFMKTLTDEEEGAQMALKVDESTPIIKTMIDILKSNINDPEIKLKALEILTNLLKFKKNPSVELDLLNNAQDIFSKNIDSLPILTAFCNLMGVILEDSDTNKQIFTDKKLLDFPKKAVERFQNNAPLNNATSKIYYELSKDFPISHEQILESPLTPYFARTFNNPNSDKIFHKNIAKSLLEIGYGSLDKKKKLLKSGFTAGLITLLNMYSSPQYYDEEMCLDVLKLIANFATVPEGAEILLKDGAIPAFRRFFEKYKENLPLHNKIMVATIGNMSYEKKPEVTNKIIDDKGLELIIDALKFYTDKRDLDTTEVTINALAHLATNPQAIKYLENTTVADALIDLTRSQLSDKLCYTAMGCLCSLANHEVFADRIFKKGGQDAAADIYKIYQSDPKNLLQATKLLSILTNRFKDKTQHFIKSGVPAKIIDNFQETWPFIKKR